MFIALEVGSAKTSNKLYRSGENHPNYKTGVDYRKKMIKDDTVCNRCGFADRRALEVHHIDRDRSNNDVSNLEVLCANCHCIEHDKGK